MKEEDETIKQLEEKSEMLKIKIKQLIEEIDKLLEVRMKLLDKLRELNYESYYVWRKVMSEMRRGD
jgi:prefoldin subunit 5